MPGLSSCESPSITKRRKPAKRITIVILILNWSQNSLMLSFVICITFADKPGEI